MTITHTTSTAKANDPAYDISADPWNEAHTIAPGTIVNADINAAAAIAQSKLAAINVAGLSGELADDQPPYLSTTHIGATAYVGVSADYQTLADEFANVWYGDGTADNAQITTSIAVGNSRHIHLDAGVYDIAAAITDGGSSDIVIEGAGMDLTILRASAGVDIFDLTSVTNWTIKNLTLDGNNVASTRGIDITGNNNVNITVENVKFTKFETTGLRAGSVNTETGNRNLIIRGCEVTAMHCNYMISVGGLNGDSYGWEHVTCENTYFYNNTNCHGACFFAGGTNEVLAANNRIDTFGDGTAVGIGIQNVNCLNMNTEGNVIADTEGAGVDYGNDTGQLSTGSISNNTIRRAGTAAHPAGGIQIDSTNGVTIDGNNIKHCAGAGISLEGSIWAALVKDHIVTDNVCIGNGVGSDGYTYSGILCEDVQDSVFVGNRCADDATGAQFRGIRFTNDDATCDYNVVTNNNVRGNVSGGIGEAASWGSNTIIRDNIGFITENRGTGSITSGSTTDVITHGCNYTPVLADIHVTLGENPTNSPGAVWVDTITATQFTVNCENDPGASHLDFSWSVHRTYG